MTSDQSSARNAPGQQQKRADLRTDARITPSQAEGDRETIDQDLCQQGKVAEGVGLADAAAQCGSAPPVDLDGSELPSKPEGDRTEGE
jgi:hypothetical protein